MKRIKGFKLCDQDQSMLLPPSIHQFVPVGHPAWVINTIVDKMDFSIFFSKYCTTNGQDAYDPRMLIKILFYATFLGTFSSREIENKLKTDTAFMYLAAMQIPSYRTIIRFRTRFFNDIESVFQQIIQICQEFGLVGLNHVAFDGTKIKANASPKQTMSIQKLQRRIKKLLKKAMLVDQDEDDLFGDGTPFVIPKECTEDPDLMKKLEKLVTAYNKLQISGEAKINLTDEDAQVMKNKQSYLPSYNMQAAIDDKSHVIVAMDVTTDENDLHQLIPMIEQVNPR